LVWLLLAMLFAAGPALAATVAGEVSFVLGQAQRTPLGGQKSDIRKGDAIAVGDEIVTGSGGHVHIRLADGGFLVVRVNSSLTINAFNYDPSNPKANEVKFTLHHGVARSISGKAAQAAKENFRLNTPTAAIGIRGTDFAVQADDNLTRVSVERGAIVLAPLGSGCNEAALGPCETVNARVLTAAMRNTYLELRGRDTAPILVSPNRAIDAPNKVSPPLPEEPKAGSGASTGSTQGAPNDTLTETVAAQASSSIAAPAMEVWWGRWGNLPGLPADRQFLALLTGNREIGTGNWLYGVIRTPFTTDLPNSGVVGFSLFDGEAYLVSSSKQLTALDFLSSSLTINFSTRTFDTHLSLGVPGSAAGTAPIAIDSSGAVTFQGYLFGNVNAQGTTVSGVLSNSLTQAAYVFNRPLANASQVIGATRWQR
jgi:hypothetical protein